jgi:hypothetical protein
LNRIQPLFTLLLAMIVLLSTSSVSAESHIVGDPFESNATQYQHTVMHCGQIADENLSQTIECASTTAYLLDCCQSLCMMHLALISEVHALASQIEHAMSYPTLVISSRLAVHSSVYRPPIA